MKDRGLLDQDLLHPEPEATASRRNGRVRITLIPPGGGYRQAICAELTLSAARALHRQLGEAVEKPGS